MASTYWDTIQIKGIHGAKKVTEDQKNATIEHAVKTWEAMGLTDAEMAFGIATMGLESAFNPHLKGPSVSEYGLGQLTKDTWRDAVKHYNEERRKPENRHWPAVDPTRGRDDPDSQINVMGPWIRNAWDRAGQIGGDRRLEGRTFQQIAYGKWHRGKNASPEGVLAYLNKDWSKPDTGDYFERTYDRAKQALWLRKQQGGR